jgi:probable HAF family extracellular repeat protein
VYASIQSASGATVQVVWTSQETPQTARVLSSLVTPAQPPVAPGLGRPGTHTAAASASPDAPVFLDGSTVGGKSAGGSPSKASPSGSRSARGKPATPKKPANDKPDASAADKGSKATLTDLGTLGGEESVAYDLNEKGQVVGKSQTASGDWHAFLWKDGSMKDLGSLGGESCACAINEKGEVAGYAYLKGSRGACRAVRWSATGEMTTLGWLKDWVECRGGAIGDTGTVIGWAASEDTSQSAALMWTRDRAVPLPSDSASAAHDINAKNVVVGYEGFNGRRTAVTWHVGAKPTKLPDLGDGWSEARAVNADGHVVGFRQPTGGRACAFISRGGKLDELKNLDGYPMSVAQGINDSDQVVGYVWKGKDNDRTERAFVWRDGSMVDLNTLVTGDAVIQRARRINNHGQITAAALINGKAHACLVELG